MKRIVPITLAGIVFLVALFMMRPEATTKVPVAAVDLPTGRVIRQDDFTIRQMPKSLVPAGAIAEPASLIGKTLSLPRTAGDLFFEANLGGENMLLGPDERAIAVEVTDSAGLAGLLKPGDRVGITATFLRQSVAVSTGENTTSQVQGAFAKNVAAGLRVLYISPDFIAQEPAAASADSNSFNAANTTQRSKDGVIVLAVPVDLQVVAYDFLALGSESETRLINLVDLLPALDQSTDVMLSLVLEPMEPAAFTTSGVFLPNLVVNPGATPTPSAPTNVLQPVQP